MVNAVIVAVVIHVVISIERLWHNINTYSDMDFRMNIVYIT